MDIRTKLIFALAITALTSMFVLGRFTWAIVRELAGDASLRHLESVAESKERDLQRVVQGWYDSVHLIRSRTQLRLSLAAWNESRDAAERERIQRIIEDAARSVARVRHLVVRDREGDVVARSGPPTPGPLAAEDADYLEQGSVLLHGVSMSSEHELVVELSGPMQLEGVSVGTLEVVLKAEDLIDVTRDYTGLGQTGEAIIATRQQNGDALIINPLRHAESKPLTMRHAAARTDMAIVRAVNGEEGSYRQGVVDYRGTPVWAATRFLPQAEWGVAVKIDTTEALAEVTQLRDDMITLGLSLSAFAIVGAALLGFYVARPIRALAEVVVRVREGDRSARADVGSEDEVRLLADAFNQLLDEIHGPAAEGNRGNSPGSDPRRAP